MIADKSFQKTAKALQNARPSLNVYEILVNSEYTSSTSPDLSLPDLDLDQETSKNCVDHPLFRFDRPAKTYSSNTFCSIEELRAKYGYARLYHAASISCSRSLFCLPSNHIHQEDIHAQRCTSLNISKLASDHETVQLRDILWCSLRFEITQRISRRDRSSGQNESCYVRRFSLPRCPGRPPG